MSSIIPTLTQAGITASFNASQDGLSAKIAHIAIGDARYTPDESQTGLSSERLRMPIASGRVVDGHTLHVTATFDGAEEFWIGEVGFFLEDGTLLAVFSNIDNPIGFKNATSEFIFAFDLRLTTLPEGSITIEEAQQDTSLHIATELAQMATVQINGMRRSLDLHSRILKLEGK